MEAPCSRTRANEIERALKKGWLLHRIAGSVAPAAFADITRIAVPAREAAMVEVMRILLDPALTGISHFAFPAAE